MRYEVDWTTASESGMRFFHTKRFETQAARQRFMAKVEQREDFYGYGDWTTRSC